MEEQQKRKPGRPPGSKDKKPRKQSTVPRKDPVVTEPGDNTRYLQFLREIIPKEPVDINDVDEMERRFNHYIDMCEKHDMKISNLAAYAAMGITRQQASDWIIRQNRNQKRADLMKQVKAFCATYRETIMAEGKINPVNGIWWQKNYDGLRDVQEHIVTQGNPLGEMQDMHELERRYLEAADVAQIEAAEQEAIEIPLTSSETVTE